jgi:O-antigen ligase
MDRLEPAADQATSPSQRAARLLGTVVLTTLLLLIVLTAIPYGTAEAWWKALFVCAVFALTCLWLIEGWLSGSWLNDGWFIVCPIAALLFLSFIQTLSIRSGPVAPGGLAIAPSTAISLDPYQTRFFLAQLLALLLAGVFLFRYAATERRLRTVINLVIGVAVASAIFGILRQTTQHQLGFALPLLPVDGGYGQFINKNHFAFLIEMGLGLTLGMIFGGVTRREQSLIYLAALLPIWIGLVLCGSRGGLIAMLAQVVIAALLLQVVRADRVHTSEAAVFRLVQWWPVRMVLLVVLVCGVVFGTLWMGGDRLATRIDESGREFSFETDGQREGTSRIEIWQLTLKMFAAHPVFGVGMGGYWVGVPAFHDASGTSTPQEAHNDYLELLASGGLVGFAISMWFAVALFLRTRQNLSSPNPFRRAAAFGAAVGIAGVAVHSLVDFGLHMIVNALVFTTFVVIATSKASWEIPKTYE